MLFRKKRVQPYHTALNPDITVNPHYHLNDYFQMNIPRVIRECERYENWSALCFLYVQNDEADNAALTMINHAADAWDHTEFKSVLQVTS